MVDFQSSSSGGFLVIISITSTKCQRKETGTERKTGSYRGQEESITISTPHQKIKQPKMSKTRAGQTSVSERCSRAAQNVHPRSLQFPR